MARLVRFNLEGGGSVVIEERVDSEHGALVGADDAVIPAAQSFQKALANLKPISEAIMKEISGLIKQPDEISLEFGVSIKAEAGVVIAKTSGEGNLKLSLKWKPS